MRAILFCAAMTASTALAAPQPIKPAIKDLQTLIGKSPSAAPKPLAGLVQGDSWRVNHYIGETEKGVVVAIGVATETFSEEDIESEKANWDGWDGTYASEQHTPLVFLFQRQADQSLVPLSGFKLPTADSPHAEFGWGFSKLGDFDGDGRPELAIVYGYRTYHPGSTFGTAKRKEITWLSVNDGKVGVQANLLTEEIMGDLEAPEAKVTYRLVPQTAAAFKDLRVTTETDGNKVTKLWIYDPSKDLWTAQ